LGFDFFLAGVIFFGMGIIVANREGHVNGPPIQTMPVPVGPA
jgi:hypothetical protein